MKKLKLFHLKNEMLIANGIANFIGVFWVTQMKPTTGEMGGLFEYSIPYWIDALFDPFAFSFVIVMTLLYEKPIRHYLNALSRRTSIPQDLKLKARRRLLNEPFVLIALDFSMWLLAAIVYPVMNWAYDSGSQAVQNSLYDALSTGLITVTVAFFSSSTCCKSGWRRISFQTAVFLLFRKRCELESEPAW